MPPLTLLHNNGNGGGKLDRSGIPANGNGVAARDGRTLSRAVTSAAGDGADNGNAQNAGHYQFDHAPAIDVPNEHHAQQAEPEHAIGEKESTSFTVIRGSTLTSGTNGQDGTGRTRSWNDRTGSE